MNGRVLSLVVALVGACTKPAAPATPRDDAAGASWSLEVEPPAGGGGPAVDDATGGAAPATDDDAIASGGPGDAPDPTEAEPGAADGVDAPTRPPATAARTKVVPVDHPLYGRLEGEGLANACKRDGECFAGGCAREVCSAERGVSTSCEVLQVQLPTDAACGCVAGECVWWSRRGSTLALPERDGPTPNQGEAPRPRVVLCGKQTCKPGQQCIEYFGIAGTSGPKFESCEWPCGKGQRCPKGTTCTTVADGPGRVCR